VLFSSRVTARIRVRMRFSVWLVSCYAHVFLLLLVVIVTRPYIERSVDILNVSTKSVVLRFKGLKGAF